MPADFLQGHFRVTKIAGTQFGEHLYHLPGMLPEGGNNEALAALGRGDDPNASVFAAL